MGMDGVGGLLPGFGKAVAPSTPLTGPGEQACRVVGGPGRLAVEVNRFGYLARPRPRLVISTIGADTSDLKSNIVMHYSVLLYTCT